MCHLSEDRLEGKEEKWSVLPLVKIAMSPLTLLTTAISPPLTLLTKAISPLSLVRTAVASQGPETALSQDHRYVTAIHVYTRKCDVI